MPLDLQGLLTAQLTLRQTSCRVVVDALRVCQQRCSALGLPMVTGEAELPEPGILAELFVSELSAVRDPQNAAARAAAGSRRHPRLAKPAETIS